MFSDYAAASFRRARKTRPFAWRIGDTAVAIEADPQNSTTRG
jgi:hypothetical protein